MSKIEKFEDLLCWQSARSLCKLVYELTNHSEFSKDWALKDQIRRAAISVSCNIAEGFERGGNKERINFLFIAKASCAEVRSQIFIAYDCNYIDEKFLNQIKELLDRTSKLIGGFIQYLKNAPINGIKFREGEIQYNQIS